MVFGVLLGPMLAGCFSPLAPGSDQAPAEDAETRTTVLRNATTEVPPGPSFFTFRIEWARANVSYDITPPSDVREAFVEPILDARRSVRDSHGEQRWAASSEPPMRGQATLDHGDYALVVLCNGKGDSRTCAYNVTITMVETTASPEVQATDCGAAPVDHGPDPGRLPAWQPPSFDEDNVLYMDKGEEDNQTFGVDTKFFVSESEGRLRAVVGARVLEFAMPERCERIATGYFPFLRGYPFHNPIEGGIQIGMGHGCASTRGGFAVDDVGYEAGRISHVAIRFEQRCRWNDPPLVGLLQWRRDAALPPCKGAGVLEGSVLSGWDPQDPGFLPSAVVNHRHRNATYSHYDGLRVAVEGANISVQTPWRYGVDAQLPFYCDHLVEGAFRNVGVQASGGCYDGFGQAIIIDDVAYDEEGRVERLAFRYETHCTSNPPEAYYGKVSWDRHNVTDPPDCTPGGSEGAEQRSLPNWRAPSRTGDAWAFVSSVPGGWGDGADHSYDAAEVSVERGRIDGRAMTFELGSHWSGSFRPPTTCQRVVAGLYDVDCNRPDSACLRVTGRGTCSEPKGRVAVDAIDYEVGRNFTSLVMRFEHDCEDAEPMMGEIHRQADRP